MGPSPIPFNEGDPPPVELDEAGINGVVSAFENAARRAFGRGLQADRGACRPRLLAARVPFPVEQPSHGSIRRQSGEPYAAPLASLRAGPSNLVPAELPVFVRISATDWVEGGWDVEQSVILAQHLKELGIDLIDVSSGALVPKARIPVGKGYQVPFARRIRREARIMTGAVGLITEAGYANEIITGGDADLVFIARELLREPYWALKAQSELGEEPSWPIQYGYAVKRRAK